MTTVSLDLVQLVAGNPDGCDYSELQAFVDYVGEGDRPAPQAASIFPNDVVEAIEGYTHELSNPANRVNVVVMLREYCKRSMKARELRGKGTINLALQVEAANEELYKRLPEWAKW